MRTLKRTATALLFLSALAFAGSGTETQALFDGRVKDGQVQLPAARAGARGVVERELVAHLTQVEMVLMASEQPRVPKDLEVRDAGEGAFTRSKARQRLFMYRFGLGNGLVVVEQGKVVAHYAGGPGDYALYTYLVPVDVDADGYTDLLAFHNVEDGADIYASLFRMTSAGPVFGGATSVFVPNASAGEEPPPGVKADAYVATVMPGTPPVFKRESYQRAAGEGWKLSKAVAPFELKSNYPAGYEPRFTQVTSMPGVDEARVQKALDMLQDYRDVYTGLDPGQPRGEADRIVSRNGMLRLMELLDTRAAVYALENATGQQVAHNEPEKYTLSLKGLTTVEQIRDAYIKHTNESLGGKSPYPPTP